MKAPKPERDSKVPVPDWARDITAAVNDEGLVDPEAIAQVLRLVEWETELPSDAARREVLMALLYFDALYGFDRDRHYLSGRAEHGTDRISASRGH
jgi:hypothetical protein